MVSFRLKHLCWPWRLCERDPSPSHSVLPNVLCAKMPHSRPRRPPHNTTSMEVTGKENETAA